MTSPAVKLLSAFSAPAGFLPTDLPNLYAWFDASDTSTITDSGGAVSAWADKSGNGNDATVADGNPTTGTRTLNGLNVLDFDGTNDRLTFPAGTSKLLTVFVVVEADVLPTPGNGKRILSTYDGAGALVAGEFILDVVDSTGDKVRGLFGHSGGSYSALTTGTLSTATPYLILWRADNTASESFVQFNNNTVPTVSAPGIAAPIRSWSIGEDNVAGGAEFWDGKIAEIVMYEAGESTMDSTDRAEVKNYLYDKWGITP